MSLLLKALENAAKNREAGGPAATDPNPAPETARDPADELTLEPLPQSARAAGQTGSARSASQARAGAQSATHDEERIAPSISPHPSQAQSVLRAGAPPSRPSVFQWFAQRPLVAFSTAAGLFAIGYGTYLYLQLTNPGIFHARPGAVATPPGPAKAPAPPPSVASVPPQPVPSAQPPITPAPAGSAPTSPPAPVAVLPSPGFTPGSAAPPAPPAAPQTSAAGAPPPPASVPPTPAATAPSAAPAGTSPAPALAASDPTSPAKGASPGSTASAAPKIAVASTPPETTAAKPRAARPAPARAGTPATADGIEQSGATQIVPVSATLASAHQALEKGQTDEAERLYRQMLQSDPRNIDAMLGLAAALAPQNKTDAAAQYYVRVLELDPRNAHAQAGLLNLSGRADPTAAEARLKQLIAREPSGFLYFSLGNLYAEHGQWAPAQAAYFQALNLSPDNPDYAFNLAVGLEHLSQPKIALNYYRRALTLAQSRGHAQFDAAKVQSRIRSLETALAGNP